MAWPGFRGTCRSWALIHVVLPTPNLARPTESNSNHVLNRDLVNQKPGWGDRRGERRGYIGGKVDQNLGLGNEDSWLLVLMSGRILSDLGRVT